MLQDERTLQHLLDEAAIRDLIARFGEAANVNDAAAFRTLWTEDAIWTIAKPVDARCEGVEAISGLLAKLRTERDFFVHFAIPGPIALDGDEANVTCVCHEAAKGPGETYYRNHAMYRDRLRRTEGGWRFSRRDYRYVWIDTLPFTGDAVTLPGASLA